MCIYINILTRTAKLFRMLGTVHVPILGAVVRHLATLGFTNVIHENVDFWALVKTKKVPSYDVLLTNPPFSGDHKVCSVIFLCVA